MDNDSPIKNYVSLLNEILSKKKILPDYKVLENGTGTSSTKFKISLEINGKTATGEGRSKKEAKNECAKEMYQIFQKESLLPPPKNSGLEDNCVGWLYQFCQLKGWPVPKFDVISEHGPPHVKIFTVSCTVNEFSSEGHGSSIKIAKHSAASKLVPILKGYDPNKDENPDKVNITNPVMPTLIIDQVGENETETPTENNVKRPTDENSESAKKKRKSYRSSKEDIDFSMDLISKFKFLSYEKKEELKTKIKNLVDSFMSEYEKPFTCSRVIEVLKERNLIKEPNSTVLPCHMLFSYFKTKPFVKESPIINKYKDQEIDVEKIENPEALFNTLVKDCGMTYTFKEAKTTTEERIVFLIMKGENQNWTLIGSGKEDQSAELSAIKKGLEFLIEMCI